MKMRLFLAMLLLALVVFWLSKQPTAGPSALVAEKNVIVPVTVSAAMNLPTQTSAMATFRRWSELYINAKMPERTGLLAEGQAFAKEHTKEIAKLIKTDPQAAIANAVPMVVRQKLPPEIVILLEERPRLRGDYLVRGNVPLPGSTTEPYARTVMAKDGTSWNAYVYGRRQLQRTTTNVSLNGVAVGSDMAVSESPLRVLEAGEVPQVDGRKVVESCPISGIETEVEKTAAGDLPPVSEETPAYETPEQIAYVCRGGHIGEVEAQYLSEEERAHWETLGVKMNAGTGSGPSHGAVGTIPSSWTTGNRSFLYIRCAFADSPADPQNEQECYDMLKNANDFIVANSYGRCYLTYAVPPLVILPYPTAWYTARGDGVLQSHARQIARGMGYDYDSYDLDAVRWTGGPGSYGGAAYVGFQGMWMKTSSVGTFLHELGHNLGLWHANFWLTTPPSVTGPGENLEYGNNFDLMGSSGSLGHYTASTKAVLSWMPQEQFWNVTRSGLYRISQTDNDIADPSLRYALRIRQDSERDYWAEFRQLFTTNVGLTNGLMMTWDRWGLSGIGGSGGNPTNGSNGGAHLLDMTPGSFGNGTTDTRSDSALWVGRTYSDPDFNIHVTPIAKNTSTTPPSIDVQVQVGDTPGNTAPSLSINASTVTPAAGGNVTLTATAVDPEGDTLAYAWVFGDGTYSLNNNAVQTKSWASAGRYQVLCTASDMKGRRTTRSVLITVGSPTNFTVSGTITGPGGVPLEGVFVANHAPSNNTSHPTPGSFRSTWTDSSGNYMITNINAGTYVVTPTLYPYSFSPVGTSTTVGPSVTGRNFTATSLPAITITYPDAVANEGPTPGPAVVRLTRAGSTSTALDVQMFTATSGSAGRNTDYTLTPAPTNSGGTAYFTIPAGAAFLDITITPINDATVEGVEYAALDFANTAAGYVMSGTARAVVPISDDDSSLPVVRLTSVDDSGHEAGTDVMTLMLDRDAPFTAALTVNLTYSGTATRPADYTAPTSVIIPAGSASTTFTLTPVDDVLIETTETIITTITNTPASYLRTSTAQSVTSTLNDDDMPVVSVVATDAAAAEAGSDRGVFTITRTGETNASLTVDYAVNGRAVLGTDYRRLDGRAVIPAGSTSITVEIVPFDDTRDEGTQDVILQLRTALNYVISNAASTATINIADDDATEIYVELNSGSAVEPASGSSNGPIFQIHRPASGTAITVNYAITGTATSGTDFTAMPGTVSFGTGSTSQTVIVSMLADTLQENAESVTLTLLPGTGYTLMPGQLSSMTGYIVDADQETVDVSVTDTGAMTTQIAENSPSGTVYFFKRNSAGALVVNYTVGGTATSGTDFTALGGTITIPDGQTSATLNVTALNDTIPEGVETIIITVTPVSGNYGTRFGSATMYIADNDAFSSGTVTFGAATASTAENVGTHNIPVNITGTPPGAVSVFYRVNGGTAAGSGIDFTLPPGVLNFAAGETTKSIPVAIRQDLQPEPPETLIVQLFNATGANLGTANQTLTIQNVSLPEAFSDPASGVSSSAMTFNGRVMAGGAATTWWFEYGGTTAYGLTTPVQNLAAGSAFVNVNALASGLTLTSYHFRLVAQNSLGISYGIDQFPGIISEPPVIVDHPQSLAVNEGDSASFTVTATGGGLSYQWQKGTTDIPLATSPIYTIPITTTGSAGTYRCVVTNADGSDTSNPATLTIVTPPVITQDPSPLTLAAGQDAVFTVTATGFFLNYQWQKDQQDLPGQVGQSLNLTSVTTLADGSYRCIVSNTAGSDTSAPATLTVNGPPTVVQQPANVAVNLGGVATFTLIAAGPDLNYQWQRDTGSGMANIDTATSASYIIPATVAGDAASYRCRISNTHGTISSDTVTLTVVSPPVLVSPLTPRSVVINESLTFNTAVQVDGLFLSYEWRRDGTTIPGSGPALSISNLAEAHNGSYTCRVWNAAGEVFTPAVTLLVVTLPVIDAEPDDTLVDLGDPATISVTASGPLLTYQWWHNGLPINAATNSSHNISAMAIANVGYYYCKVTNSAGTATTRSTLVGVDGMPVVTQTPFPVLAEAGAPMRLEVKADGDDLAISWKQNSKPAGSGAILDVWPYASKHAGLYVAEVRNLVRTTTTTPTTVATVSDMSPALDLTTLKWSTSGPVFWRPTVPAQAKDGKDAMSIGNIPHGYFSTLSTRLTGPLVLKWWQKVSTQPGADLFRVQLDRADALPPVSGESDWQEVSLNVPAGIHQIDFTFTKDDSISGGSDRVWLDMVSTSPAFETTGTAGNHLVASGTTVTFNATYTGSPASFQWRRKGAAIKGATNPQFVINGIKTTEAGNYDCVLTGLVNGVSMTRITPPVEVSVVDATGSRQVVPAGAKLTLSAIAVGKGLSYKWRRGNTEFPGEIGPKISLTLHQASYSDDYICAVTNSAGTVDAGIHKILVFQEGPELTLAGPLPQAFVSGSYSFQVPYDMTPAKTPTIFTAKGLPKGLVIHKSTGVISGIADEYRTTGSGQFPITITASNSISSDTVETSIYVRPLGYKAGSYTSPLARNATINQNLGGRIDFVIAETGSFTGTLWLGAAKFSFKSRLGANVLDQSLASAHFDVPLSKTSTATVDMLITDLGRISGDVTGTVTVGSTVIHFIGWEIPWSKTMLATAYVGTQAPAGTYNFALDMPVNAEPGSPQGVGYGSFVVSGDTGMATIAGRLPDGTTYTSAGGIGIAGQMLLFTPLYTAPTLGSLVGQFTINAMPDPNLNDLEGEVSWSRPPMPKQKIDPDGFSAPVTLTMDGGRYVAPVAPTLAFGLTDPGLNTLGISFFGGGIGSPAPSPNIIVTLTAGSKINYPSAALNPRKTALVLANAKGTFSGQFSLVDSAPLAPQTKLTRGVAFQGLMVPVSSGMRGAGYFLLPELPDATGETLTNTPVQSGEVELLPAVTP